MPLPCLAHVSVDSVVQVPAALRLAGYAAFVALRLSGRFQISILKGVNNNSDARKAEKTDCEN